MSITTQNDVTNALTTAIQTIAESNAQAKEATLTIEAKIVEKVDEGLGTYIVEYLGNKFEATAAHTEITYEIDDMVYVVVPNGNFDKNKIILSPVNPSSIVYATNQEDISYVSLGDNLFKSIDDVSLCTYKPHDIDDPSSIVNIDTAGFSALFQSALTDSRIFNFTCKIQTNIEKSRRSKGNYGLSLDIPVIQTIDGVDTQTYYNFTIDVNNITGNPYDLEAFSLQNFYFTLPDDMVYDSSIEPRIRSFIFDFMGEDNTKPDDIFITNIQLLSTLGINKEDMVGYYSVLTATGGNSFLASRTSDTKTISVTAYLNGKITKVNNFDCYWFKENVTINNNSDKYQRFGGLGWEILNKVSEKSIAEDGRIIYQYITNIYSQNISQAEIHCDTKFKCVLVKDDIVINSTIVIKNLASDAIVELTSLSGSTTFSAGIGNVELQLKYFESGITDIATPDFIVGYSWQRLDKKGVYIDNDFYTIDEFNRKENNTYYTKIHYPVSKIDEVNTVSCTVYIDTPIDNNNAVRRQIIGTVWITLTIGDSSAGRIVITNGDKLYKYDADGDSPMVADYDGPLTSAIKTIDPISIRLYKEDGTEFTSDEYKVTEINWLVPVNSMITLTNAQKTDTETNPGYYTIKGKYPINSELSYGISKTYNKNKLDNTIIIQAFAPFTILKKYISNVANIKFLKDGESGTNGSKYSAIITYENYGYGEKDSNGKIHKLQLVYAADNNTWYLYNPASPKVYNPFSSAQLNLVLYVDGERVSPREMAKWNIFDGNHHYTADNIMSPITISNIGVISLNGNNWTDTTKNFCVTIEGVVKASIISTTTTITNSDEYVYAYYPIECSYVANHNYLESLLPTLEGGFSKVLFAADGTNPQYDNSENFYVVDPSYSDDISDLYNYSWAASSNMTIMNSASDPTCEIAATTKYDNGVAKNFVRVSITRDNSQVEIITAKRNELNNKKLNLQNLLGYYEILQDNIDIFGNFDYNNYINRLTESAPLYSVKTNLIKTVNQLLIQSEELSFLCEKYKEKDDGSIDVNITNVSNEVIEKINLLNNLSNLCNKLGTIPNIINEIKAITLSMLTIDNKIVYTEGIPERNCYFTINDNIDLYNNTVNEVYATYLALLDDVEIIIYDANIQAIINDLSNFVNSNKLHNLTNTYDGCNNEAYRYKALEETLQSRLASASIKANTYSYNLFIENILRPMYDSLLWYIIFYNNGGYNDLITELTNQISDLTAKISILDDMLISGNSINIIHIKPIIMIYNRYELSHINGWDGNKLELGDGYLIAPQVGAGYKDQFNRFTGMVIGVKQVQERSNTDQKIGMFGYYNGAQSLFLNATDGSAIFGKSGTGQVIIDPREARGLIYSSSFWINYGSDGKPTSYSTSNYNYAGMLIDLSTPEIRFGDGNFVVNSDGHITAAGGGSIAGWDIDNTKISSKISIADGRMVIDSGAIVSGTNPKGEKIYTAETPGKIYTGRHNELQSTNKGFYLSQDGLSISGEYEEIIEGITYNRQSRIELNTTGNPTIYSNSHNNLNSNNDGFYLGGDGLSIGRYFRVDSEGKLSATDVNLTGEITANSGSIANWTIQNNCLYSSNGISIYPFDKLITAGNGTIKFSSGGINLINSDGIIINGPLKTEYGTGGVLKTGINHTLTLYDDYGTPFYLEWKNGILIDFYY